MKQLKKKVSYKYRTLNFITEQYFFFIYAWLNSILLINIPEYSYVNLYVFMLLYTENTTDFLPLYNKNKIGVCLHFPIWIYLQLWRNLYTISSIRVFLILGAANLSSLNIDFLSSKENSVLLICLFICIYASVLHRHRQTLSLSNFDGLSVDRDGI